MATIDQLQYLEISRKGYLITPNTNLDYIDGTNDYEGIVGYDGDPNLITLAGTLSGTNYKGKLKLWQLPTGTHYTSPALVAEYVKVAQPTGADMANCWKKISFDGGTAGSIDKDLYNAYTVLAATNDNDPQPITLNSNSVLGRVGNIIQSIFLDTDLITDVSATHDTIPTAKAVVDFVNNQIAGALSFNGGYNVALDQTGADTTKKLQTAPYPVITKGDTYVVTVGATLGFFGTTLGVGDMIIANINDPRVLADWTLVIKNIPTVVDASTTEKGIVQLATAIDNNETKAVTPKLVKDAITFATSALAATALKKYFYLISNPAPSTVT